MNVMSSCRCCLSRPPEKSLQFIYKWLGETEVYWDMLKECFDIHLQVGSVEGDSGICDTCVQRLREAHSFMKQVLHCQKEFDFQIKSGLQSVKEDITIKEEASVDISGNSYIEEITIKEEVLDDISGDSYIEEEYLDDKEDNEDEKNLSLLALENLNSKSKLSKELTVKKVTSLKPEISPKIGRKSLKMSTKPVKLSLKDLKNLNILSPRQGRKSTKMSTKPVKLSMKDLKNLKILSPSQGNCSLAEEMRKHQHNVTKLVKHSNLVPFFNKTLNGYICIYCKNTIPDATSLRQHTLSAHKQDILDSKMQTRSSASAVKMDITDLKCNICNKNVDVVSNLKKHLIKEHDIKMHMDVHDYILEFKLTDGDRMDCALCNSTFETFKMLLQHMNGHYRNFICDICDLGYINLHKLRNHKRTHELGTFKCSYCDKIFQSNSKLTRHKKFIHSSGNINRKCPHCDESFSNYYQRNRHMVAEHKISAASYKCNICDRSFLMKSKLTHHIKKVHLMERNHICPECGDGFFLRQYLEEHMIKHKGERIHKCDICSKAYARKKTLREHMRIHNNDRRFKCGICGMAFVQKCSLKSHMLSNHGIALSEYENEQEIVE